MLWPAEKYGAGPRAVPPASWSSPGLPVELIAVLGDEAPCIGEHGFPVVSRGC